MKRSWVCLLAVSLAIVLFTLPVAASEEGRPIAGVDVGVVQPIEALDRYTDTGGVFAPFLGYMFNKNLGLMGQLQVVGAPNKDRVGQLDDDATWILGGAAGPRLSVPLGDGELYGTGQAGIFTGLAPRSVTDTSLGISAGAGINGPLTDRTMLGIWVRWNRLYQRVHATNDGDIQYVSAGLGVTFDLGPKEMPVPPAPAPVVSAPPPPPPAPAVKKKIVLRGVNFDTNKSNIRADAKPVLDEAVSTLQQQAGVKVLAEGHTDSDGSDAYNQGLSMRRARSVRDYLAKGGVKSSRISVDGKGESMPVASNATADGKAQNRRVELKVIE